MNSEAKFDKLTADEEAHLRLWASATPAQRLAWLEEAQRIAYQSGALQESQNKARE
ncbi:MAG: hypothetical protein RI563_11710 [Thiohalophilus sp.]|uniref:hypothetical protein n=1 Tax=Thiohalophilus sp. TaxID=3028392 RepID=UPI0028707B7D|nr:hypothetical protein [Thiohalophilus sp.]MDR9437540.1 hypothetical protein [Thiohalophilus sp.]